MAVLLENRLDDIVLSPPEIGTVLYMPGLPGDGSRIYDRSPYGNHGTITGAVWKRLPSGLWYLYFDGTDDQINVGVAASLNIVTLTVEAWVNLDDITTQYCIMGNGYDADNGYLLAYYGNNGWALQVWNAGTSYYLLTGAGTASWTHVMGWFEAAGNTGALCVNGVVGDSSVTTGAIWGIPDGGNLQIGTRYSQNDLDLAGGLALPRIRNRISNVFEAQNHFNREKHLFGVW